MLRYLGEIVWVPSAALSDYITWEEMDSTTARATMSYGGITASGIFKFDENGAFVSFEADRYYYRKEGYGPLRLRRTRNSKPSSHNTQPWRVKS